MKRAYKSVLRLILFVKPMVEDNLRSGPEKKYHAASNTCVNNHFPLRCAISFVWCLHQGMWKADFRAVHSAIASGFEERKEGFQVGIQRDRVEFVL